MKDNQIQSAIVFSITTISKEDESVIAYRIEQSEIVYEESQLFGSAADVISSLTTDYPDMQKALSSVKKV